MVITVISATLVTAVTTMLVTVVVAMVVVVVIATVIVTIGILTVRITPVLALPQGSDCVGEGGVGVGELLNSLLEGLHFLL